MATFISGPYSQTEVIRASAAATTSSTSDVLGNLDRVSKLIIQVKTTASSGTSPTLNVYVQIQLPNGTDYMDIGSFTQFTGTANHYMAIVSGGNSTAVVTDGTLTAGTILNVPFPQYWRIKWVVAGTSPSFTLAITGTQIQ